MKKLYLCLWALIVSPIFCVWSYSVDVTNLQQQLDLLGYKATVKLINNQPTVVGGQKHFKPYQTDHLSILNTISIEDPQVVFEKQDEKDIVAIKGTFKLFYFAKDTDPSKYFLPLSLNGSLTLKDIPGGKKTKILEIVTPPSWKLSDSIPKLKESIFDEIALEDIVLVISPDDFHDTDRNMKVNAGLNLIAHLRASSGPEKPFTDLLNISGVTRLQVVGHIPENPFTSSFRIQLSKSLDFKTPVLSVGEIGLEVGGGQLMPGEGILSVLPTISLVGDLFVKPSPIDDPLTFVMRMVFVMPKPDVKAKKFGPPSFIISATMDGKWKHPFGIPGINIGSDHSECIKNNVDTCPDVPKGLAIQAQITPPSTGLPDNVGLTGAFTLGKRHVAMAVQLPLQPAKGFSKITSAMGVVIYGELDEFTLNDSITLLPQMMGLTIPGLDQLPLDKVGVKQVKVYIVPTPTAIGEIKFHEGLTLRGDIFIAPFESFGIPRVEAYGLINLSRSGLEANAFASAINFGPLHITKSDKETADDAKIRNAVLDKFKEEQANMPTPIDDKQFRAGPMMHLALSKDQQELLISGKISLANLFKEDTYIKINQKGFTFDLETTMGDAMYNGKPLLDIEMKADATFQKPINFHVLLSFQQHFKQFIVDEVHKGIEKAKDEITKGISQAKHEVSEKLGGAEHTVSGSQGAVGSGIGSAQAKARHDLKSAQDAVDSLQKDIDHLKDSIKRHEKGCLE